MQNYKSTRIVINLFYEHSTNHTCKIKSAKQYKKNTFFYYYKFSALLTLPYKYAVFLQAIIKKRL